MHAVDQDGDVVDVYLQARRNAEAARRFFRRLHAPLQFARAGAAFLERPPPSCTTCSTCSAIWRRRRSIEFIGRAPSNVGTKPLRREVRWQLHFARYR